MRGFDSIRAVLDGRADVRLAYVFGSGARGEGHAASDIVVEAVGRLTHDRVHEPPRA